MADKLQEVIAKMKAKQQAKVETAPQSPPTPAPKEEEIEAESEDLEQDEEMPVESKKVAQKPSKEEIEDNKRKIAMEIELLQNDGRFRAELLHQLQELNRALVVIAGTLVDLSGK